MFDMGFTEMLLIGIVALVVIGPERLPGVARTAGKYFSKLRNFMMNVRADVESELKADELRQMFEKQQEELQSLKDVVNETGKDIGLSEITDSLKDIDSEIKDISSSQAESKPKATVKSKVRAKSKAKSVVKKKASPKVAPKANTKSGSKLRPKSSTKSKAKPKAKSSAKTKAGSNWTKKIVPPDTNVETNSATED